MFAAKMSSDLKVARLEASDAQLFEELVGLLNEVFEESPSISSKARLVGLLSKPDFYALVALKDGNVLGGLTAYELQSYYNERSEIYVYDMAVKSDLQGQGIGTALIQALEEIARGKGVQTIFVEAHSEDVQAVKFYESTFGESEKVDHFNLEVSR